MIKKSTKAIFLDGEHKGEYDWKGGIPLSEEEVMTVEVDGKKLIYELVDKKINLRVIEEDQEVEVIYIFEISKSY